jgi:hypothetical protein
MELLVNIWQRLHYNVYRFNAFSQIYVVGLPFTLLYRNKYIIKIFSEKRGIKNPEQFFKKILTDPKNSTVMWISDVSMCILVMLMLFTVANLISSIFETVLLAQLSKLLFLVICLVPSMGVNYYLLWKDNKYLTYFNKFEQEPKEVKRKWAWISFGVFVGIILLLIASFWIMTEAIH